MRKPVRPQTAEKTASVIRAAAALVLVAALLPAQGDAADIPASDGPVDPSSYAEIRATHWALQPIGRPAPPEVNNETWPSGPIDRFILARLEAAGLAPSPPADRRTLLRRATFDLLGLPPTPEEVEAFLADDSPEAFAHLVERLLASPHYGERWGRHWLDVARYADTKGYVFTQEPRYPYSYTYRDYVIRSLNEDLPFDRFVLEQLAADKLATDADPRPLAALGFLTLGRRFNNDRHDIIDDRIDVVSRGFLGLTVTCARCHDHKYDPIPVEDYYSLYGVFASSIEPGEKPLIASPDESEAYQAYKIELDKRQKTLDDFQDQNRSRIEDELRSRVSDYLVHVVSRPREELLDKDPFVSIGPGEVKPAVVRRWRRFLSEKIGPDHAVFGPWHKLAALADEDFATAAAEVVARLADVPEGETGPRTNNIIREALTASVPATMEEVAHLYGKLLAESYGQWQQLQQAHAEAVASEKPVGNPPQKLDDAAAEALRQVLFADDSPTTIPPNRLKRFLEREPRNNLGKLETEVETWKAGSPDAPARAMALVDAEKPFEPHVFVRGNPHRHGKQVPRQFLSAVTGEGRQPFTDGSGRLELARAIVDETNPLTARVIANRLWQQHFGFGLVRTASDFGTRGEPPTHPELLDYLASKLIEDGWSLKTLHRRILLSAAYAQASANRPDAAAVDPENRLLGKTNRQRLEFEPLRDAMLAVAGRLDTAMGGRAVDLFKEPFATRRTVYGFIDRQDLPGTLRIFDLASPDSSTSVRPKTTVPQQALYLMNSPFVVQQAKHLAAREEVTGQQDTKNRVHELYRIVLSRAPTEHESTAAIRFITTSADVPAAEGNMLSPLERLAQTLLLTNEFMFID